MFDVHHCRFWICLHKIQIILVLVLDEYNDIAECYKIENEIVTRKIILNSCVASQIIPLLLNDIKKSPFTEYLIFEVLKMWVFFKQFGSWNSTFKHRTNSLWRLLWLFIEAKSKRMVNEKTVSFGLRNLLLKNMYKSNAHPEEMHFLNKKHKNPTEHQCCHIGEHVLMYIWGLN